MNLIKNLSNRKAIMNEVSRNGDYIEVSGQLLKSVQSTLLDMLLDIDRVCAENNIQYFLVGGSCLGAIRHHGFIPWDDDVDIAMTREAYQKFCGIFEQSLGEKYILNAPNYSKKTIARFPKILKRDSILVTDDTNDPELCKLYVDIFVIENVPDSKLVRNIKGTICNGLEFIAGQVQFVRNTDKKEKSLYKKQDTLSYSIRILVGKVFGIVSVSKYNDWIDHWAQYNKGSTQLCTLPTGRKHYFGEILPRNVFSETMPVDFAGYSLPVMKEYDVYLKNLYGDYMQIPPEDKREHHYVKDIRL